MRRFVIATTMLCIFISIFSLILPSVASLNSSVGYLDRFWSYGLFTVNGRRAWNHVQHIQRITQIQYEMGNLGRIAGSLGEYIVGEYILNRFRSFRLNVRVQVFQVELGINSRNIIGTLFGSTNRKLVIGAHYDAIGGYGADDNAAGVATLLEIALVLTQLHVMFDFSVEFVAFGAEEVGLKGSFAYVDALTESERDSIIGMINIDVNGYGISTGLRIAYFGESYNFPVDVVQVARRIGYAYASFAIRRGWSDDLPFYISGIPSFMLQWVGSDEWYSPYIHSFLDIKETVNPKYIEVSAEVIIASLLSYAQGSSLYTIQQVPPVQASTATTLSLKI